MDIADHAQLQQERELRRSIDTAVGSLPAAVRVPAGGRDCAACGDPIPMQRLRVLPGARRCVGCQLEHERDRR